MTTTTDETDFRGDSDDDAEETDQSSAADFLRELAFAPRVEPPTGEPSRVGETLGRYRITGLLGRGGMGVVYAAHDLLLKRDVALKLLSSTRHESREDRRRFLREARAAAAVVHPNIVGVFQVGEVDGVAFIAMERVEGRSLRALMTFAGSALLESGAVHIARQVALGLAASHAAGVSHRDIKPENVMISNEAAVKLVDFGLAKTSGSTEAPDAFASTEIATREGHLLGTPSYMSPEQARGLAADARSDIFAFGVVLFELLARKRPFGGETAADVLASIVRDAPPPLPFLSGGADGPLARVVSRCLEKDPSRRYAHASELLVALEAATRIMARAHPQRARPYRWCGVAEVGLTGLGLAAVWLAYIHHNRRAKRPPRARTRSQNNVLVLTFILFFLLGLLFITPMLGPVNRAHPVHDESIERLPLPSPSDERFLGSYRSPAAHLPRKNRALAAHGSRPVTAPFRVPVQDHVTAIAVADGPQGSYNVLALTSVGDILAWQKVPVSAPTWFKVDPIPEVTTIATDGNVMMAVDRKGGVWAWTRRVPRPIRIEQVTECRSATVAPQGVLVLHDTGAVSLIDFWEMDGENRREANWIMHPVIQPVAEVERVKATLSQGYGWLGLRDDGTVWSWKDVVRPPMPKYVRTLKQVQELPNIVQIASGVAHSLALDDDGVIWTWRTDTYNDIRNTAENASISKVTGLPRIRAIAAGNEYSLALDDSGTVWQWGTDWNTEREEDVPHPVAGVPSADLIVASGSSSFAVSAGETWFWMY